MGHVTIDTIDAAYDSVADGDAYRSLSRAGFWP
jgi:hypothetical protein